jgi:hypothetical protein
MKQQTLAMAEDRNAQYEQYRKPTKRDAFLATMEQIVPWAELCSVIEPHYPKAGNGRPTSPTLARGDRLRRRRASPRWRWRTASTSKRPWPGPQRGLRRKDAASRVHAFAANDCDARLT